MQSDPPRGAGATGKPTGALPTSGRISFLPLDMEARREHKDHGGARGGRATGWRADGGCECRRTMGEGGRRGRAALLNRQPSERRTERRRSPRANGRPIVSCHSPPPRCSLCPSLPPLAVVGHIASMGTAAQHARNGQCDAFAFAVGCRSVRGAADLLLGASRGEQQQANKTSTLRRTALHCIALSHRQTREKEEGRKRGRERKKEGERGEGRGGERQRRRRLAAGEGGGVGCAGRWTGPRASTPSDRCSTDTHTLTHSMHCTTTDQKTKHLSALTTARLRGPVNRHADTATGVASRRLPLQPK